jgi:hypothetical protein
VGAGESNEILELKEEEFRYVEIRVRCRVELFRFHSDGV